MCPVLRSTPPDFAIRGNTCPGLDKLEAFVFLLIILQVYNSSLILENVDVDWNAVTK